jgi:hypothetical protein
MLEERFWRSYTSDFMERVIEIPNNIEVEVDKFKTTVRGIFTARYSKRISQSKRKIIISSYQQNPRGKR